MSDLENERPREFQPVEPDEATKFLKEGARTLAAAMIWTKNQENVVHTHLSVYSEAENLIYVWVPKEFDPSKFMDEMAKQGVTDCFFSVSLSRANIFFKCRFVGYDSGGLKFKPPEKVFKVQRRKDMRFPIPDGYVLKVAFQDPLFPETQITKKVIDISAGGIAIIVSDQEEAMFHPGLTLKEVTLTVRGKKIVCDAEVRHLKVMPSDSRTPGVKLGLLFQGIKAGDSQHIASYVFEESRKYFSRFM